MILIGDKLVPYENISVIKNISDISLTKPNSTVIFSFDEELLTYCFKNEIASAVIVDNLKEAIYANSLKARYIISNRDLAIKIQKCADNYMFDSRVLSIIETSDEIESIALNEIDGVIYKNLI